ncbi:TPA: hypothetical protein DCZ46_00670 [Candidatus Campbellbacteria bacterium]|nr:MAG: coiled-coil [Candidatus Campbellbacteria bacterium GW2011_OD1_34_28]KKP75398.1 MAG: hypothetical protein UR74_C0001G0254 [Candidatus Campbellbacteria bacterium GW2011_GWD2_35_24]KKP76041.1 MAG: hypothetical protein UR75_C0001G0075 [Candidatus Campbellbacteria bacterium GW2011_GWC2_35_28]KKP77230.1 MAG: hypothetical protein UR76_C0001G0075 [Candidatus Campbellbacteria bacterium GW2011_GWC1_35_31]KKP79159.1 MAG: hypothetical protein UR79_C0001G0075 [Candidatus Campbellbacteria bacterium G
MINKFKNKIKSLREARFPGKSIRSLSKELEPYFGEHYYAYISKFESGVLPPIDSIKKIKNAYNLSENEYDDLVQAYLIEKFEDHVADVQRTGSSIELQPEPLLFRKVNKKKK